MVCVSRSQDRSERRTACPLPVYTNRPRRGSRQGTQSAPVARLALVLTRGWSQSTVGAVSARPVPKDDAGSVADKLAQFREYLPPVGAHRLTLLGVL